MTFRTLYLGDRAVTFEFGSVIDKEVSQKVLGIHALLKEAIAQGQYDGLIETVPTFRSITVHYDPLKLLPDEVEAIVKPYLEHQIGDQGVGRVWSIPCCYEADYAPDLAEVASLSGVSVEEIISIHSTQRFDVFMLGFLPGFSFMGLLDDRLVLPRRSEPRTAVPKGSVAIADKLTAVYPSESPGGWHLIGRTPIEFFDLTRKEPALLRAGDKVSFRGIGATEFETLQARVSHGDYDPVSNCLLEGAG